MSDMTVSFVGLTKMAIGISIRCLFCLHPIGEILASCSPPYGISNSTRKSWAHSKRLSVRFLGNNCPPKATWNVCRIAAAPVEFSTERRLCVAQVAQDIDKRRRVAQEIVAVNRNRGVERFKSLRLCCTSTRENMK